MNNYSIKECTQGEGLGRGSGRVRLLSAIAGRVGSGQRFAGSGRVGSKKSDPWTTLHRHRRHPHHHHIIPTASQRALPCKEESDGHGQVEIGRDRSESFGEEEDDEGDEETDVGCCDGVGRVVVRHQRQGDEEDEQVGSDELAEAVSPEDRVFQIRYRHPPEVLHPGPGRRRRLLEGLVHFNRRHSRVGTGSTEYSET